MKIFFPTIIIFFIVLLNSCSVAKFTAKLNDIDSVIRIVNPYHNCGCNYGDKTISLPITKDGKLNTYFWQAVYVKNGERNSQLAMAKNIKTELVKLMPELANYKRIFLEFRENETSGGDSVFKFHTLGTAFLYKNNCNGYMLDITAKELIKKTHNKTFENRLCNK